MHELEPVLLVVDKVCMGGNVYCVRDTGLPSTTTCIPFETSNQYGTVVHTPPHVQSHSNTHTEPLQVNIYIYIYVL